MDDQDALDISEEWAEWMESLSDARKELMVIRILRECEDPEDEDEFTAVFERVSLLMFVQDTIEDLKADGLIEVDYVNEDGETFYKLTDGTDVDGRA